MDDVTFVTNILRNEKYRFLCNPLSPDMTNKTKRDQAWEEIAEVRYKDTWNQMSLQHKLSKVNDLKKIWYEKESRERSISLNNTRINHRSNSQTAQRQNESSNTNPSTSHEVINNDVEARTFLLTLLQPFKMLNRHQQLEFLAEMSDGISKNLKSKEDHHRMNELNRVPSSIQQLNHT